LEFYAVNTFEKPSAKDHAGGRIHFEKGGIDQIPRLDENGRRPFDNDDIPGGVLIITRSPSGARNAGTFVGPGEAGQDEMDGFSVLKSDFERLGSRHRAIHALLLSKKWANSWRFVRSLFLVNYQRRRPRNGLISETKRHTLCHPVEIRI
jgi:hypothetical protein